MRHGRVLIMTPRPYLNKIVKDRYSKKKKDLKTQCAKKKNPYAALHDIMET